MVNKAKAKSRASPEGASNAKLAAYCNALAQPVRVRILTLLIREHCMYGDLASQIPLAQSTISQHLKTLKEAGLISSNSVGQRTSYCISEPDLRLLKSLIGEL